MRGTLLVAVVVLAGCGAPPSYAVDVSSPTFSDNENLVWWTEIRQVDYGDHKANGVVLVRCVREPRIDCDRYRVDPESVRRPPKPEPEPEEPSPEEPEPDPESDGQGGGDVTF